RAMEIGLLTRAVPETELDEQTSRYADLLLRGAPGALGVTKTVLHEAGTLPVADGLARMAKLSAERFASAEAQEGMAAFAQKRDPAWAVRP
ncbi:MAG TPA: enoyl-CoA hydratase-related protein, partial [Streptosporangiaceae bacterium]|nr:enoyl-CoA hydratase-related protein [Streptosporangiaceae bacterium]